MAAGPAETHRPLRADEAWKQDFIDLFATNGATIDDAFLVLLDDLYDLFIDVLAYRREFATVPASFSYLPLLQFLLTTVAGTTAVTELLPFALISATAAADSAREIDRDAQRGQHLETMRLVLESILLVEVWQDLTHDANWLIAQLQRDVAEVKRRLSEEKGSWSRFFAEQVYPIGETALDVGMFLMIPAGSGLWGYAARGFAYMGYQRAVRPLGMRALDSIYQYFNPMGDEVDPVSALIRGITPERIKALQALNEALITYQLKKTPQNAFAFFIPAAQALDKNWISLEAVKGVCVAGGIVDLVHGALKQLILSPACDLRARLEVNEVQVRNLFSVMRLLQTLLPEGKKATMDPLFEKFREAGLLDTKGELKTFAEVAEEEATRVEAEEVGRKSEEDSDGEMLEIAARAEAEEVGRETAKALEAQYYTQRREWDRPGAR